MTHARSPAKALTFDPLPHQQGAMRYPVARRTRSYSPTETEMNPGELGKELSLKTCVLLPLFSFVSFLVHSNTAGRIKRETFHLMIYTN